jgi:outer membrane protein assembly factor BamB
MTNMKLFFIYILLSTVICCTKEKLPTPTIPPPPTIKTDSTVQLLWAKPVNFCYQAIIYSDQVGLPEQASSDANYFTFRDSATGEILWRWGQDAPKLEVNFPNKHFIVDNLLSIGAGRDAQVIDIEARKTHWASHVDAGGNSFGVIGHHYYHTHRTSGWAASLVRTELNAPNWDTLYTIDDPIWDPVTFLEPNLYINLSGDSILIFIEGAVNWQASLERITLTGININTKEVVFRNVDFEPDKLCNANYMRTVNGKVYKLGRATVWCFDAENGNILWSRNFDPNYQGLEHFMGLNYAVIHKDWIIAKGGYHHMEALDLKTGQVIWKTDDGLSSHYSLHVYKNKYIIYAREGGGGIAVHRLSDGKLIYQNRKLLATAYNGGDLAIDHANDRIYWCDGINAYCFRLNLP